MKTILLVEDNEDDVFFMERAKAEASVRNPMHVARNGQEAVDYLEGNGKYADRNQYPLPFLVLLDLKLPFMPGLDVLKWIREHPQLKTMLVVVLTSSKADSDIDSAYRLGANSYLVKPPTPVLLTDIVKSLGDYWILKNQAPVAVGTADA
jgi:CheY-like chemotaxis protein